MIYGDNLTAEIEELAFEIRADLEYLNGNIPPQIKGIKDIGKKIDSAWKKASKIISIASDMRRITDKEV